MRTPDAPKLAVPLCTVALLCLIVAGCTSKPSAEDSHGTYATSGAPELYAAYETALKAHRRDTLAQFYHPRGAVIVFNGMRMIRTQADIDSTYRRSWRGPAFFAFDSLQFHAIAPTQVVVTGAFRWLPAQSRDTARYVYLAILDRTADGLKIRVEHETERPGRRP